MVNGSVRSSAARMKRHRARRRRGTRCITVHVNENEVATLVAGGYLSDEARGEPVAIKAAIRVILSDLAFELEQRGGGGSRPCSCRSDGSRDGWKSG
jgi:hypothetical protein